MRLKLVNKCRQMQSFGICITCCCWKKANACSPSLGTSLCHHGPSHAVLGQRRSAGDKQVSRAGALKEELACLAKATQNQCQLLRLWGSVPLLLLWVTETRPLILIWTVSTSNPLVLLFGISWDPCQEALIFLSFFFFLVSSSSGLLPTPYLVCVVISIHCG